MNLPPEMFSPRNGFTDFTIEGIRKHARRQLGVEDQQCRSKCTGIVTLTEGQWNAIERVLDFADKMKEINATHP